VYAQNYADRLGSPDQRARHYQIVGAIRDLLLPTASIFDVGCGCETTYGLLDGRESYRGIDLARAAIDSCAKRFRAAPPSSGSQTAKARLAWKRMHALGWPVQETTLQSRAIGSSWSVKVCRPLSRSIKPRIWDLSRLLSDGYHLQRLA
jgi:hypothetical protein